MMLRVSRTVVAVMAVLLCVGFASQADAVDILDVDDANYVGLVVDGIPSNPADEVDYINNLTSLAAGTGDTDIGTETYNREGSTICAAANSCPDATTAGAFKDESETNSIDATGYEYVVAKYDAANAGTLVWYIGGEGFTDITVPLSYNGHDVSHISLYNSTTSVPEPHTLVLLGSALVGLGLWRRRR